MLIVETGGFGLMGRELARIRPMVQIGHEVDIRDAKGIAVRIEREKPNMVVHLAALVDTVKAETDHQLAYDTNVVGTKNVARVSPKLLYVSTDYVFDGEKGNYSVDDAPNPLNYYGLSKLLGEYEALEQGGKVLRLSFKPRPYKHAQVPKEMYFSGGYVDDMAREISTAIDLYDRLPPITHVGIARISLIELARQTRDVKEISLSDIALRIPRDVSFNLQPWEQLKN